MFINFIDFINSKVTGEVFVGLKQNIIDILLSMNAESVSMSVFAQCAHNSNNFAVNS